MAETLPVHGVLPELLRALGATGAAVLVAPPGAGKTTAVAPALLDQSWCEGDVILLSPRRVAARAAAERMADMLGEAVGRTVGYLTRMDSRTGPDTRILVMTEAIFVNRLLDDPELPGVSAVMFDEAHERHLDSDLGLALALESRAVLRPDLRICVMSATIDGARFASLLGEEAIVIESEGRAYPLDIRWLDPRADVRIEDSMAAATALAWRETEGDLLAFLPGVREIERTREQLEARFPDTPILSLHGQVLPADQRLAIRRDAQGRRRIVLATAIAETSLTLDGVRVVVDSGLSRQAVFDHAAGTTRLVTRRASQAAAGQRAGRAARQGPGVAYRLWAEAAHPGRPPFAPPEIETADLAPLVLSLAQWGAGDPQSLPWLDAPPLASVASARGRLEKLGALDDGGCITDWGRKVAALPMDPVSAAAVRFGARAGCSGEVAKLVLLAQERGLGGRGEDLLARLSRWDNDQGTRAEASRKLAARWARAAEKLLAPETGAVASAQTDGGDSAICLALANPDNIARRRSASGEHWVSAGGRGYLLDPANPLASAEWLIVVDAQGPAKGARITAAAELAADDIENALGDLIESRSVLNWNDGAGRVEARLERQIGAIMLASGPDPAPDRAAIVDKLVEKGGKDVETLVPASLLARGRYAGIEALSPRALRDTADQWLRPLVEGRSNLAIPENRMAEAVSAALPWSDQKLLRDAAPASFTTPAGSTHAIDYAGDDAPCVTVRVQAMFGLDRHPLIGTQGERVPLLLKLTSPANRPVQATRDLPGFWRGSWADVRRDMKGRYPKHRWPDEPWLEAPSLKTRKAFERKQ
ncbi:MAG: ATP-dependent helicase HrpB [Parerythrobacter sp.]